MRNSDQIIMHNALGVCMGNVGSRSRRAIRARRTEMSGSAMLVLDVLSHTV